MNLLEASHSLCFVGVGKEVVELSGRDVVDKYLIEHFRTAREYDSTFQRLHVIIACRKIVDGCEAICLVRVDRFAVDCGAVDFLCGRIVEDAYVAADPVAVLCGHDAEVFKKVATLDVHDYD